MASFKLGLTMAGAISAGAYTAGVFDFLMEALDAWERRKAELRASNTPLDQWDVPSHDVVIPVMSGASAGSVVGALGLVALAEVAANAAGTPIDVAGVGRVTTRLPRLYRAWVQLPCFINEAGGPDLLGTTDLAGGGLASLLDSTCLSGIAEAVLLGVKTVVPPRPYLADTLHLFVTHTSLRGVPYDIGFSVGGGAVEGYGMLLHGDRRHFAVKGMGSAAFESGWAAPDPALDVNMAGLAGLQRIEGIWAEYATGALGSSAFPVGLAARPVSGDSVAQYAARQWPLSGLAKPPPGQQPFRLTPAFPQALAGAPDAKLPYVTVDGGTIDNEPFELARWTLMETVGAPNPRSAGASDRAVLMIDPFPEPPAYDSVGRLDVDLASVLGRLVPAMIDQARFKPNDLADALSEGVYSRFLIAPRRRAGQGMPLERFAIACGLLGGFGGFLSEAFRAHDYQLGRLNCFLFLRDSLAFPAGVLGVARDGDGSNAQVRDGYGAGARLARFQPSNPQPDEYQLIPLVGSAATMPAPPNWPRVSAEVVDQLVERAVARGDGILGGALTGQVGGLLKRGGVQALWSAAGKSMLREAVRLRLLRDLVRRDQIEGETAGQPEEARLVIAALLNPAFDYRTTLGIAAECAIGEAQVSAVLADARYKALVAAGPVDGQGRPSYTHVSRKPGWFASLPGVRQFGAWAWSGSPRIG